MKNTQLMPDANFVSQHLGYAGEATNVQKQIFTSESQMDAAITSDGKVAAKDKPHLTMNDKVFATRYAATSTTPTPAEAEVQEEQSEEDFSYDEEDDE